MYDIENDTHDINKFQKGKIYKLIVGDEFYIGSTTTDMRQRLYSHKCAWRYKPNSPLYHKIHEWKGIKCIILEHYKCDSREELLQRERYWVDAIQPSLNTNKPYATKEELVELNRKNALSWYYNNKDKRQTYYEKNKQKIQAQARERYKKQKALKDKAQ